MSDDFDDPPEEPPEEGAPAWLATFADLMSLLMCFFVLLLSFSEIDAQKYKQVAGSMAQAFGVQRAIEADVIPKGTTVISQEYTPGKPLPTVIEQIRQVTTDERKAVPQIDPIGVPDVAALLQQVTETFSEEIDANILEVVPTDTGVKIRVNEKDSFPSGSAVLQRNFQRVLDKLTVFLNGLDSGVIVEGHTDNVPIRTSRYPSNWVLSAARSASVVHYMTSAKLEDPSRIEIRAHADSIPIVENDSRANRARNRRVEININLPSED